MRPRGGSAWRAASAGILLLLFTLMTAGLIRDKSPVTDTVAFHAVNGYVNWMTHDFRMSPATPPLVRLWVTLPWAVLWRPALDLAHPSWAAADSVPFGVHFFYEQHRDLAPLLLASARWMNYALALLGLLAAGVWARRLYGPSAAVAAMALLAFMPTWTGYAGVVDMDIGIALFYLTALMGFHAYLERDRGKGFPWTGALSLGAAMATKFTGVLLIPLIFGACLVRLGLWKGLRIFAGVLLAAFTVVWASYFFECKPLLGDGVPRIEEKEAYVRSAAEHLPFLGAHAGDRAVTWAKTIPVPLPTWWLGFAGIARSHQDTYRHFFMGEWRDHQVWYHYFFSFLVKTPLPFLVLLVWGLVRTLRVGRPRAADAYLLLPVAFIFYMTARDSTGVGMRYLLPVLPLLCVWVSRLFETTGAWKTVIVWGFAAAQAAASILSYPNHLAYFNELIGGPSQAYRYFRANDLEWGQEVRNLARYVRERGIGRIRTHLFGVNDPTFYGIPAVTVTEAEYLRPERDWYAITVMWIDHFEWARGRKPDAVIGHTIWVYDMTGEAK